MEFINLYQYHSLPKFHATLVLKYKFNFLIFCDEYYFVINIFMESNLFP